MTSSKIPTKSSINPVIASSPELAKLPTVTDADITALVGAIDTFAQSIGAQFSVPQPEEIKRLPKARREAPTIVTMIGDLSTRYSIASLAYPYDVTKSQQELVNTLTPVVERLAAAQKLVSSILSVGQSAAWSASMVTYGLLKSEARGNAVLRKALQPVRDKLRITYETEDGGKTVVRSRSKKATAAKEAAATAPSAGEGATTATSPSNAAPPQAGATAKS